MKKPPHRIFYSTIPNRNRGANETSLNKHSLLIQTLEYNIKIKFVRGGECPLTRLDTARVIKVEEKDEEKEEEEEEDI